MASWSLRSGAMPGGLDWLLLLAGRYSAVTVARLTSVQQSPCCWAHACMPLSLSPGPPYSGPPKRGFPFTMFFLGHLGEGALWELPFSLFWCWLACYRTYAWDRTFNSLLTDLEAAPWDTQSWERSRKALGWVHWGSQPPVATVSIAHCVF